MRLIYLFFIPFLLSSISANATLGEVIDDATDANIHATKTNFASYTKHATDEPKLGVRQFADNAGLVFGLAWQGKTHPDLISLLGAQYPAFQYALRTAKSNKAGHSPISVDAGNMHLELGGTPRAVFGRVWLIRQVPPGVNTDDLR
jgi:hypothetical protein